jgi:hypothetical protein
MDSQILVDLVLDIKKDMSEVRKDLSDVKIETVKNTASLDKHMLRSDLSEARLEVQEEKLDTFITEMVPVKEHVKSIATLTRFMGTTIKVLGVLASVVGAILGILKFLR